MTAVRKTRFLMVLPSFGGGGAEKVGVHLLNAFDESRYEILVVIFEDKFDYFSTLNKKIRYINLRKRGRADFFRLVFAMAGILREFKPDVVVSLLHYFNLVCGWASMLVRKNYKLVLCEHVFHSDFVSSRSGFLKKAMMRFLYARADHVVAISDRMKSALLGDMGLDARRVVRVYNPLPLEEIRKRSEDGADHSFFGGGRFVILAAGRLSVPKRFDVLLDAFAHVVKRRSEARLLILGRGEQLEALKDRAGRLGIASCVDFVGFQPNPYAWMKRADLFVLSSDLEGFPMVLIEAMACGAPVVSSNCPSGPDEIIEQGKNGLLVPVGDAAALAEAILDLSGNPSLRADLARRGAERVADFDTAKIGAQYEALWKDER